MIDGKKELKEERKAEKALLVLLVMLLLSKNAKKDILESAFAVCAALRLSVLGNALSNSAWKWFQWEARYAERAKRGGLTPDRIKEAVDYLSKTEPKVGHYGRNEFVGDFLTNDKSIISTEPTGVFGFMERKIDYLNKNDELKREIGKSDLLLISSHAMSSERCFPDQGKVVSASMKSIDGDFWTGKVTKTGAKIYSLRDMLARVDSKGYHNFIISGFNCKHHLTAYIDDGEKRPVKVERPESDKAESELRGMERRLRQLSNLFEMSKVIGRSEAKRAKTEWDGVFAKYKRKCADMGEEPILWRCL